MAVPDLPVPPDMNPVPIPMPRRARPSRAIAYALSMAATFGLLCTQASAQAPTGGGSGAAAPSAAQRIFPDAAPDDLIRVLGPGDTIGALAARELDSPARWRDVARYNGIANARAVRAGTALRIRPEWLKSDPVVMKVEAIGGTVTIDGAAANRASTAREGSVLDTADTGTVELLLPDGTRLKIPPASRVRVERLRSYHGDEAVDARLRLERGGIEAQSPARRHPLEIRSPAGNAAVRGTDFRVRGGGSEGFIEVLTGAIAAESRAGGATIGKLEGGVVSQTRAPQVEPLLPAPALAGLDGQRFTATQFEVAVAPVPQAREYRVDLARDAGFVDMVRSFRQPGPTVRIETDRDGPLYLRMRAVSAAGLEGVDAQARLDVAARPVPPAPVTPRADAADALAGPVSFAWSDTRPGLRYRVQLAADAGFRQLIDETIVDTTRATLVLPPAPAGTRYWRVAAIDADGREGPFGAPVALKQRVPAPILRATPRPVWRDAGGEPVGLGSGGVLTPGH